MDLSPEQRSALLDLAYHASAGYLGARLLPAVQLSDPALTQCAGAFVTLIQGAELRGCIGHIRADMPLYRVVQQMAIAAATEDPRFPPMCADELENLEIEISVLSPLQTITNIEQVEVGKHGLLIAKGGCRGLLLPQVAVEHGLDRYAFADAVCWKAGLPPGSWRRGATIQVFTALVFGKHFGRHTPAHEAGVTEGTL
ncbi:MAG: AmmeMemoRadiSam system protein A [Chloroflexi bacterium]|nr:AmmeMemoRadiSam system protein A [Chloroflexota bacterium]